ncbi:MAG: YafY family protein [Lachnospiraceae bacterium]|nr:YafY family protein [Lachnospiraceae bacterium]
MKESRLFKIVYYILENGRITASELAERFEVSVRTIYRDIDVISSAGIPIYVTTGRNGGIQLLDHYVLDKSFFSDKEKQDILAAMQSVALVNGTYEKEVLTKLSALFHIRSDNWFEVDFSRWGPKNRDNATFELLKNAVISHKAVRIVYVNSYGERSKRKIYPLKMLYKAKEWYIKAYCVYKSDFRIFKFNRIMELELLAEEFEPMDYPEREEVPRQKYNRISLCFPKEMAYRVYDEFETSEIEEKENGDLFVSSVMPEDHWLIGYLLSFGAKVQVIEPVYLRKILSDEAKKIYEKNKP